MSKTHLMIDIETLGTGPDSVILTIGAQGFDPTSTLFTDATYYKRLDIDSQQDRSVNDDTIAWWSKQSQEAQDEAMGDGDDRVSIKDALDELGKLIWKHDIIWCNGASFDFPILDDAFVKNDLAVPWKYWNTRDTRTVYSLVPNLGKLGNNHNALADCVNQIDMLQKALKLLGITKL